MVSFFDVKLLKVLEQSRSEMDVKRLNFDETCRTCGTTLPMNCKASLFKTAKKCEVATANIIDLLDLLQLNINKDDGLPQQICMNCIETIIALDKFYKTCKRIQEILWSVNQNTEFKNEVVMKEEVEIKEEDIPVDPLQVETNEIFQSESITEEPEISSLEVINESNALLSTSEPDLSSSNANDNDLSQRKSEHVVSKEKPKKRLRRRVIDVTRKKGRILNYGVITECRFCKEKFANVINHQRKCPERSVEICKYCDMETANAELLNEHIDEKHPNRLPACIICSINFPTFRERREHRLTFHDRFQCEFCQRCFSHKGGMDLHKRRVHGEQIDKSCTICQKKFNTQAKYDYHMRTHDPEKLKFHCQFCEKRFHRKHHWQHHERTHTGERPHLCEVCGDAYNKIESLRNHRKSHLGTNEIKEKPRTVNQNDSMGKTQK